MNQQTFNKRFDTSKISPLSQSHIPYSKSLKFIISLIIACQLLNTSCSRQIYPDQSFENSNSQTEKRALRDFMEAGAERTINTHHAKADEIIKTAQKYIGVPHCMGGTSLKCMDCSGLLVTVFAKHGISLPHSSEEQARYGKIIDATDKLKKGDMVFFIRTYKTKRFITHSGIYIGDNRFIHTSSSKGVTISSLNNSYWKDKFIFGTRVLKER